MLLTQELHPNMGAKVINYLKQLEKLPGTGFVAGQAVLSTLLALYGKGQTGPINDIDLYLNERKANPKIRAGNLSFNPDLYRVNYVRPTEEEVKKGHYSGVTKFFNASKVTLFRLSEVTYTGLINTIKIKHYNETFNLTPHQVLESFDLNMVKVGVNLADKKLYWTRDFDFFIKTGQLEVSSANSPFHTICRINKKQQEMPWLYTNTELNFKTLLLPRAVYEKSNDKELWQKENFGKKYFKLYSESPTLQELFDVQPLKGKEFYTCVYKPKLKSVWTDEELSPLVNTLESNFAQGSLYTAAMALAKPLVDSNYRKKGKHYDLAKQEISDKKTFSYDQFNLLDQMYVDGQVQLEWSNRIENFITKHKSISKYFVGHSLDIQSKLYTNIKKLESEFGEYIIGLLETNNFTSEDLLTYTHLQKNIQKYHDSQSEPFKNFEPLPMYKHGTVVITDLKSRLELMMEGNELKHCVGGYSGNVETGRSRILSLRSPTEKGIEKSTAELAKVNTSMLERLNIDLKDMNSNSFRCPIYVVQHRSFANGVPIEEHAHALNQYVSTHNNKYLSAVVDKYPWDEELNNKLMSLNMTFNIPKNGRIEEFKLKHLDKAALVNQVLNKQRNRTDLTPVAGMILSSGNMADQSYLFYKTTDGLLSLEAPNEYAKSFYDFERNVKSPHHYNVMEQIGFMIFKAVI